MSKATFKTLPPGARIIEPRSRAHTPPPAPPNPTTGTNTPAVEPEATQGRKPMEFTHQVATGEHLKQFPHLFRLVVMGPAHEQQAVEAALQHLKQQKP